MHEGGITANVLSWWVAISTEGQWVQALALFLWMRGTCRIASVIRFNVAVSALEKGGQGCMPWGWFGGCFNISRDWHDCQCVMTVITMAIMMIMMIMMMSMMRMMVMMMVMRMMK